MILEAEIRLEVIVVDEYHTLGFACLFTAHSLAEHHKFTDAACESKITSTISKTCFPTISCILPESEIGSLSYRNLTCVVL